MIEKAADGTYPVTINGREYIFTKWGAEKAFETLAEISAYTAESFSLLAAAKKKGDDGESDTSDQMIAAAVRSLTGRMAKDPKATTKLVKRLICDDSVCDGHPISFNLHFQGKLMEMFQALYSAMQVQYGDFINAAVAIMPRRQAAQSSPSAD